MANYTAQNAIDFVKKFVKDPPISDSSVDDICCDLAQSRIWIAYPWRWTLGALTAISLVDGTQDYTIADSDFYRPINLRITRTDLTPDEYQPLKIYEHLEPELSSKVGWRSFQAISWEHSISKLRLEAAASVPTGITMRIDGDYQKTPTKITALTPTLITPDWYFETYCDWLLYYLFKYTNDSRAGGVEITGTGAKQYTGQLAKAMESLRDMATQEDYGNGVPLEFPDEPLMGSHRLAGATIFG